MCPSITPCCSCPSWVERALSKVAQFEDDDVQVQDPDEFRKEVERDIAKVKFKNVGRFINLADWGKGKKRPISVPQGQKNKAQKALYEATKGYHPGMPTEAILEALALYGFVPVGEDGEKWSGMLIGSAKCGSEEAKDQRVSLPTVMMGADGKWGMTNMYLSISYCKMPSGRYEVVSYLS